MSLRAGKDLHSQFANPQFLNTISISTPPNLYVQPTSPAVNAGYNLGSSVVGTLNLAGTPRMQGANIDLGAYEQ